MASEPMLVCTRNVVAREIAGESVLIPVVRDVAQLGSIFVLNEVASFVWANLSSPTRTGELLQRVTDAFEVPDAQARADVERFIDELLEAGLIRVASDANA